MKKLFISAIITILFISCDGSIQKPQVADLNSKIKSNIIYENTKVRTGINPNDEEKSFIMIIGKTLLEGTAIIKTTNTKGEEIHCESFPAKNLIQKDYKTANSTLKESHLREVVQNYFEVHSNTDLAKF